MHNRLLLSVVTIAALSACASQGPVMTTYSQANLPDTDKVPSGHGVVMETTTTAGEITYQCRAKKDMADQFEWVFVGPAAGLKDRNGAMVGKYYGPPATWESKDGSKVMGTQVAVAPNGEGNIPNQLVKANPAMGAGAMQGLSYIQRVATVGGTAPKSACTKSNENEKQVVQYLADYIFYKAM
ncbi:MAG: DUF3455 domain-containing protein [Candidatus Saccharibacteria bacterium]|nr:DUF3455 domain-containing protein [Rhodoferax sp.]